MTYVGQGLPHFRNFFFNAAVSIYFTESGEMLDIIYKNFVVDPADLYQWSGLEEAIIAGMRNDQELSSLVAKAGRVFNRAIENTMLEFEKQNEGQ